MEKITTYYGAWDDFFIWVKDQPEWKELTQRQKQYLYKADLHRRAGKEMSKRIRTILEAYAPERYTFTEGVIIHQ